MDPYYYVFRVGGSNPRTKHPTLAAAHTEAMRLANQHPGDCFEILQCLGSTRTVKAQTFWVEGVTPPEEVSHDSRKTMNAPTETLSLESEQPPANVTSGGDGITVLLGS